MASSESELKRALGAFKKRLKMIRLDDDSRLGHGPMSSGRREKVVSIQPPSGFGRAIWEELADLGYLKRDTSGFYEVTDKQWQNMPAGPGAGPGAPPPAAT
jgi:hypothetical protein